MDELGSFVDVKGNKQWVPLAMDTKTREVIGCHIGDRSSKSALALWDSLPSVDRLQCQDLYRSLLMPRPQFYQVKGISPSAPKAD